MGARARPHQERRPAWLETSLAALLVLALASAQAAPGRAAEIYVKRSTFAETMLASRQALQRHGKATGFSPSVHGYTRKDNEPRHISVDVSNVERLHLIAHHEATQCSIPAVWGEAKLIAADGTETRLAALKPASAKALRGVFVQHDSKPLALGKKTVDHGLYALTPAEISYDLGKRCARFEASIWISDRADKPYRVRFKVLDRPNAEDLCEGLWKQVARDHPLEAARFSGDGDYWFGNRDTRRLEERLCQMTLDRMGDLGEGLRRELAEVVKSKAGPDDPVRLTLFSKTCRFYAAQGRLQCVNIAAIRTVIGSSGSEGAKLLARLAPVEGRLADIHAGMTRGDETVLRGIAAAVADARSVLCEAVIPVLGTEEIVFAVRDPGRDGHWYANFGYWCSDPSRKVYCPGGSRLAKLNLRTGEVTNLLADKDGAFRDPQVHYDGSKLIVSYRKGGTDHYNLYEVGVDGKGLRQLTSGPVDDIEPTYLPDGDIIFCSSRCNRWVNCWHTPVAILYRCGPDGNDIRPLSSNVEHDNTPWPLPDGRILYTRWEYVDRSQMAFHHLWTINPDGTGQMTYYGNSEPGRVFIDAKPIPGTNKILASFCPGHGRREHAGAITIVSPDSGPDNKASERTVNKSPSFRDPYPISASLYLVARDNQLLLMDDNGTTQELYRAEKHLHEPRPVRPRPREHQIVPRTDWCKTNGRLVLQDVTMGRNTEGVKRGEIRKLLILESLPKPVNHSGGMDILSELGTFTLERLLGTVPVEADGSAHFELPANRAVFFVALDENDLSVKRMQSFTSVLPGETTSCVGCHEHRVRAPAHRGNPVLMATQRPPSTIRRFEGLPDVIDFPRHVQPILDKHCVKCHSYEKRSGNAVLVNDYGARRGARRYTQGYWTLLLRKQFADGGNAYGNRPPRAIGSGASPLMHKILAKHGGTELSEDERRVVWAWIETGAVYAGTYAALLTTTGPTVSGSAWAVIRKRCASCHGKPGMQLPTDIRGIKPHYYRAIPTGAERFATPLLFNESRPEKSMALLAPLAKEAGGYGICPGPVFKDTGDPDYQRMLAALKRPAEYLKTAVLYNMPAFKPNVHYVREMQRYAILPASFDPAKDSIDVFATDQAYWRSMWHLPEGR